MTLTNKKPVIEQCFDWIDYIEPGLAKANPALRYKMATDLFYEVIEDNF
jgi:hypothetical protein